jgi:hypothetical protein
MHLRRPGLYARLVPSISMAITLHKAIKEEVTRGKKMGRKSRMGKHLLTELVTWMGAVMPLRPKRLQFTHPSFPMPQSPSSHSYSFYAQRPIFKMLSS